MASITATYAKNNIGHVWEMAKSGPVEVLSNGSPVAVVLSPDQYEKLNRHSSLGRPRRLGVLAKAFEGFDTDAFLDTDVSRVFSEYLPS